MKNFKYFAAICLLLSITLFGCNSDGGSSSSAVSGISLNKESTTLLVDGTEQLTATINPSKAANQKIIWSSSNNSIVKVDLTGLVSGVNAGTATITATTEDGNFTSNCEVTVSLVETSTTGISIEPSTTIFVGTKKQLLVTITPVEATNQNYSLSSSNDAIVKVNGFGIQGVSTGTATITATTADGGFTASVDVTVVPITSVTGITLNKATTTIERFYTETLYATIAPVDASIQKVLWYSSDESVATVDFLTGLVYGVYKGTATITAMTTDGEFVASCLVTVIIPVTGVTLTNTYSRSAITLDDSSTGSLTTNIFPSDASDPSVTYSIDDTSVATVNPTTGLITPVDYGKATLTVTTNDGGYIDTATVVITGKDTYTVGALSFDMAYVPGGYTFNSYYNYEGSYSHTVNNAFYLADTEVTYELWNTVYNWAIDTTVDHDGDGLTNAADGDDDVYTFSTNGRRGYNGSGSVQQPVTYMRWRDAMIWCNALTEWYNAQTASSYVPVYYTDSTYTTPIRTATSSSSITYYVDGSQDSPYIYAAAAGNTNIENCTANGFRLPTWKEWEMAFRYIDGSTTFLSYYNISGDLNNQVYDYAVWYHNSGYNTAEVGTKLPNFLGIYDMSGNVEEHMFDYNSYDNYDRIYRGGAFNDSSTNYLSCRYRSDSRPYYFYTDRGFRVSRSE